MRSSLSFSVRRHFVDTFFHAHTDLYRSGTRVLDIGGRRLGKRGTFDIGAHPCTVKFVNLDATTEPDIIADAALIPVPDNSYDIAVMGELLEHVSDPKAVIRESYRLLRPGGQLLATVPFMYPLHADPHDFGRYTDTYWQSAASDAGFSMVKLEPQGTLFAVLALAVQHFFLSPAATSVGRACKGAARKLARMPLVHLLMWCDRATHAPMLRAWTTGYGIIMVK